MPFGLSGKEFEILKKSFIPYRAGVYRGVFFGLIAVGLTSAIPYIYGRVTDAAIYQSSNYFFIGKLLLLWLILTLIGDFLKRLSWRTIAEATIKISGEAFYDISNYLVDLPIQFHKDKKVGKVFRRVTRGTDELGHILDNVARDLLPQFVTFVMAMSILFFVRWELAVAMAFVIIGYATVTIWRMNAIVKSQEKMWIFWEKSDHSFMEALNNVQAIKSTVSETREDMNRRRKLNRAHRFYYRWLDLWRALDAWQQTIFSVGFVGIFALGIYFLSIQKITPGELIMFVGYINLISEPLFQLGFVYRQTVNGAVAVKRMLAIYKVKKESDYASAKDFIISGRVEFCDVYFTYKSGREVLRGLSFVAESGQTVALVGGSGVGKTTSMDLISRYYAPRKGSVLIDGHNVKRFTLKSLRGQIALLPQEVVLFYDTIMENIRYGKRDATDKEVIEAAKLANAHDFIEQFPDKYDSVVGERGVKLSVGQKDRVGIARAILRRPKILILDEPTSNLDAHSELAVQEALKTLMRDRTTFIIAHRLSTIAHADKIMVFEAGRVVEEGTHTELMAKDGAYKKLHDVQFNLIK